MYNESRYILVFQFHMVSINLHQFNSDNNTEPVL